MNTDQKTSKQFLEDWRSQKAEEQEAYALLLYNMVNEQAKMIFRLTEEGFQISPLCDCGSVEGDRND